MNILYITDDQNMVLGPSPILKRLSEVFSAAQNQVNRRSFYDYHDIAGGRDPVDAVYMDFSKYSDERAVRTAVADLASNISVGALFAFNCNEITSAYARRHGYIVVQPGQENQAFRSIPMP